MGLHRDPAKFGIELCEVKDSLLGTPEAKLYEQLVSTGQRLLDNPDKLSVYSGSSMVDVFYLTTKGKYIMTPSHLRRESMSSYLPPANGLNGYTSSKWASERYLEKIHDRFGLPITIYRPSSISHEDATETLELIPNLIYLSRMLQAVPVSSQLRGSLNIVALDTVVDGIMNELHLSLSALKPQLKYTNLIGGSDIPFSGLKEYIKRETGVEAQVLLPAEWVKRAENLGLPAVVGASFTNLVDSDPVVFLRLTHGL
ncbi:unnamed protein product [Penicillium glandicola]